MLALYTPQVHTVKNPIVLKASQLSGGKPIKAPAITVDIIMRDRPAKNQFIRFFMGLSMVVSAYSTIGANSAFNQIYCPTNNTFPNSFHLRLQSDFVFDACT